MKKYLRQHGVIVAYGILLPKTQKYLTTRWNIIKQNIIKKQQQYDIKLEENCAKGIFLYDNKNNITQYNICSLEPTILNIKKQDDLFQRISDLAQETELNKIETINKDMIHLYLIHVWR